jgi:hypothetical protein
VALYSHDHDVAIYRDGRIAVLGLDGTARDSLYHPLRVTLERRAQATAADQPPERTP